MFHSQNFLNFFLWNAQEHRDVRQISLISDVTHDKHRQAFFAIFLRVSLSLSCPFTQTNRLFSPFSDTIFSILLSLLEPLFSPLETRCGPLAWMLYVCKKCAWQLLAKTENRALFSPFPLPLCRANFTYTARKWHDPMWYSQVLPAPLHTRLLLHYIWWRLMHAQLLHASVH